MESFRLTKKDVERLSGKYPTPFVVISLAQVERNYDFLKRCMPRVHVYYAMKANPAPRILETLARRGASFDTASAGEIETLARMGIAGTRMIYANPVKTPQGLAAAAQFGVRRFTFDDRSEIKKMAEAVPGAEVLVRVRVKNQKALVDLNAKFGAEPEEAIPLLGAAKAAGLSPAGVCFHVGSQSLSVEAYHDALHLMRRLFDEAAKSGMTLSLMDIGGGFPIPTADGSHPDAGALMTAIEEEIERLFPDVEIWAEPGRFLSGTAVNLVTSVIGEKTRGGQIWYILDEGLYGTFSGVIFDHWTFDFVSFKPGRRRRTTLVGPSCDSIDFVRRDVLLPRLAVGDKLLVPDCGAYTTASATTFNGFALATEIYWEDQAIVPQEAYGVVPA
ncbi:MAG: type III PLP-dependent enzyme [Schwartzia sp. (in: firmicutes)]